MTVQSLQLQSLRSNFLLPIVYQLTVDAALKIHGKSQSTDTAAIEEEIVYVRTCNKGDIKTSFLAINNPDRADANCSHDAVFHFYMFSQCQHL
jgi:hypothetical protein